jgi:DNA repair protein RecO (recombination protein O)
MNIVDLVFYDNQKDTLSRIKEARVKTPYTSISRDVIKSSIGMLMIEIFRNAVKEKETNYELYQFLREWLMHLDARKEALGNLAIQFSIELSSYLGFQPVNNYDDEHLIFDTMEAQFITDDATNKYCISPELSELVHRFLKSDRSDIHMIQITRATRSELLDKLIQYYQLHLESFRDLKSINILRQVLG